MPENNAPATREELRQELATIETRILTAFHSYARGVEAKIRVSQTIGLAGAERLDALEARVLDIEGKLLQR
jgi:hypothetical protein